MNKEELLLEETLFGRLLREAKDAYEKADDIKSDLPRLLRAM